MCFVHLQLQYHFTNRRLKCPPDKYLPKKPRKPQRHFLEKKKAAAVMSASNSTLESRSSLSVVTCVFTCGRQEWLIFLALSNYKVNQTKTVRNCCRCTGLMFPPSLWLNVGSGCRSHAGYCFHILCSLSNGLLKTDFLLFWPHWLQSGMPWHRFPFLGDRRSGRRCRRRRKK